MSVIRCSFIYNRRFITSISPSHKYLLPHTSINWWQPRFPLSTIDQQDVLSLPDCDAESIFFKWMIICFAEPLDGHFKIYPNKLSSVQQSGNVLYLISYGLGMTCIYLNKPLINSISTHFYFQIGNINSLRVANYIVVSFLYTIPHCSHLQRDVFPVCKVFLNIEYIHQY